MSTKRTKTNGQFTKGTSGNPAGRPPGSRNRATLLMESLLEGDAEQLTRKAIEMALAGDVAALRLCLERIVPPRKDRPIHLVLPAVESVEQISASMGKVFAAVCDGEITPTEGEVLSNILAAQKAALLTGDLARRVNELEERISGRHASASAAPLAAQRPIGSTVPAAGTDANLSGRLARMERRLGAPPPPISLRVYVRAWTRAFSMEELNSFEIRWEAAGTSDGASLLDIFGEGTAERLEIGRRLAPALDAVAMEMTGRSYAELLQREAEEQK